MSNPVSTAIAGASAEIARIDEGVLRMFPASRESYSKGSSEFRARLIAALAGSDVFRRRTVIAVAIEEMAKGMIPRPPGF
jgi:hypothetical protein